MASATYGGGVALALTTSFMNACGLMLQKLAHRQIQAKRRSEEQTSPATAKRDGAAAGGATATTTSPPADAAVKPTRTRFFCHPLWLTGLALMVVASLASLGVFALLGQARASAFATVTVGWNMALSRLMLGEQLTVVDLASSAFIVAGSTLAMVFGSSGAASQAEASLDSIFEQLRRPLAWQGALVVMAAGGLLQALLAHAATRRRAWADEATQAGLAPVLLMPPSTVAGVAPVVLELVPIAPAQGQSADAAHVVVPVDAAAADAVAATSAAVAAPSIPSAPGHIAAPNASSGDASVTVPAAGGEPLRMVECACRALTAGLFSGTTGLLSKIVVVGLVTAVSRQDAAAVLGRWEWYISLIALVLSLVLQLRWLNSALSRFEALEAVPIYQSSISLIGMAFGWVFGSEASDATTVAMTMFAAGCSLSCVGVLLLMFKVRLLRAARSLHVGRHSHNSQQHTPTPPTAGHAGESGTGRGKPLAPGTATHEVSPVGGPSAGSGFPAAADGRARDAAAEAVARTEPRTQPAAASGLSSAPPGGESGGRSIHLAGSPVDRDHMPTFASMHAPGASGVGLLVAVPSGDLGVPPSPPSLATAMRVGFCGQAGLGVGEHGVGEGGTALGAQQDSALRYQPEAPRAVHADMAIV
jgi:hypothetical protein